MGCGCGAGVGVTTGAGCGALAGAFALDPEVSAGISVETGMLSRPEIVVFVLFFLTAVAGIAISWTVVVCVLGVWTVFAESIPAAMMPVARSTNSASAIPTTIRNFLNLI